MYTVYTTTIMIYSKKMAVQRIAYTRINGLAFKVSSITHTAAPPQTKWRLSIHTEPPRWYAYTIHDALPQPRRCAVACPHHRGGCKCRAGAWLQPRRCALACAHNNGGCQCRAVACAHHCGGCKCRAVASTTTLCRGLNHDAVP